MEQSSTCPSCAGDAIGEVFTQGVTVVAGGVWSCRNCGHHWVGDAPNAPFTMTAHFDDGLRLEVPCYTTDAPGLVVHEVVRDDMTLGPGWVLAHQPSGMAIARGHPFLVRGEASYAASLLAPKCDWKKPPEPDLIEDVRSAFRRATRWRDDASPAVRSLVAAIADDVIRTGDPARRCDGKVHRVALGWGYALVRPIAKAGDRSLVLRFSPDGDENNARTVWRYEPDTFPCIDCGTEM